MSHQVISLKYRPQEFEDVVGQEHITLTLKNAIKKNRLGHAYIFSGPRGTGKTTTARLLAKVVNCEDPKNGNPCNACASCREITEGRSLDVFEIDGASNRGIDSIRDLREQVKYPPARGKYRVYIIDEFHQITKEAFNALLKTLEEPPRHILFIFATTELTKVPPTILSRCQRFEFKRIPLMQVVALLRQIAEKEGISIDDDSLLLIAKKGDGSIRDSESILEQVIAFSTGEIRYESVLSILGVIREEIFFEVFEAIAAGQADRVLQYLEDMLMRGYDLQEFVSVFSVFLRDLYMVKAHGSPDVLNTTENLKKAYRDLALDQDEHTLIRMLTLVNDALPNISRSANVKILVESLFIKLSHMHDFVALDRVLEQLKQRDRSETTKVAPVKASPVLTRSAPPERKTAPPGRIPDETERPGDPETPPEPAPEKKDTPADTADADPQDAAVTGADILTPEDIKEKWNAFIACVQPKKPALAGLLCNVGISGIYDDTLVLASEDTYSCESLQRSEQIIRSCLKTVFGVPLSVRIEKKEVSEKQRLGSRKKIDDAAKQVIQEFEGELL
jgi:DNA polymerase-3 subunit gamma/tau